MRIEKGDVEFILKHFEPHHQPPFPRRISTFGSHGKQYICESLYQCLEDFAFSKWIDCRINAYNYLGESNPDSDPNQGRGFTAQNPHPLRDATREDVSTEPSFIMIDIDRKSFPSDTAFQRALRATMRKINDVFLLDKDARPCTILDTGGGAHFLIPLECDPAKFGAPQIHQKEDLVRGYNPNDFIRFCARFFSNGHVDKGFFPSINSTMVRLPNSINSKYQGDKALVKIITRWNGKTKGHIICLLGEFYRYMQAEQRQRHKKLLSSPAAAREDGIRTGYEKTESQRYWYVEELLSMGIGDFRKRAISLLLAPWCITIKKMDHYAAERTLLDWTDKCEVVKPLNFDAYKLLNQALVYAESREYRPLGLFRLKEQDPELYTKLLQQQIAVAELEHD